MAVVVLSDGGILKRVIDLTEEPGDAQLSDASTRVAAGLVGRAPNDPVVPGSTGVAAVDQLAFRREAPGESLRLDALVFLEGFDHFCIISLEKNILIR
jgi:hypothetical protein